MLDTTEHKSVHTPEDIYPADETYHRLLAELTQMVAEPFEKWGTDAETEVVRVLGEIGGVWPASVLDDEDRD